MSRATITPRDGYTINDVRWLKQQAADKPREELRTGASGWLADRLPGSFHRLHPGELPAIELLVTERQLPWDEREAGPPRPLRGWTQLLDLESFDGYWQCTAFPWLRLRERRSHGWGSGPRHLLTLGVLHQVFSHPPQRGRRLSSLVLRWVRCYITCTFMSSRSRTGGPSPLFLPKWTSSLLSHAT